MLATWLEAQLIAQGHLDFKGVGRRTRPRQCASCHADVLVGYDGDVLAFEVTADPVPLSAIGEVLALVEGRRTVAFNQEGGKYVFNIRYVDHIRGRIAGASRMEDVLRTHRCGTPPPAGALAAASAHPSANRDPLPADAPAPF